MQLLLNYISPTIRIGRTFSVSRMRYLQQQNNYAQKKIKPLFSN